MCIAKFIHLYCQGTANESIFKNKIVVKILSSISKWISTGQILKTWTLHLFLLHSKLHKVCLKTKKIK